MIKCPRCSFEQPEDVFCASCGVNMQTFKARRARPRVGLYAAIVVGLLGLGWLISSLTGTLENVQRKLTQNQIIPDAVETEREANPAEAASTVGNQNPSPFRPATDTASQNRAAIPQPPLPPAPDTASAVTEKRVAMPEKLTNQIRVEFALISKESLLQMNLASGAASSNLVPKNKFEEVMRDTTNQTLASESHTVNPGQTTTIIQGGQLRTKENIGFNLRVAVVRATDTSSDLRIAVSRALPEVAPNGEVKLITSEFNETVTVPAGQVFAMAGLLPRKNIMPNEDQLYATNVLRALLYPGFQKFDQEFVIFVSPF